MLARTEGTERTVQGGSVGGGGGVGSLLTRGRQERESVGEVGRVQPNWNQRNSQLKALDQDLDNDFDMPVAADVAVPKARDSALARDAKQLAQLWLDSGRQTTRHSLYSDDAPSLDCDSVDQLDYDSPRPFSHVHQRGLWHASLQGTPVIVKKPVAVRVRYLSSTNTFLLTHILIQEPQQMAKEFEDEAHRLQQHESVNVVR